jgi:hypothetical protein
MAQQPPFSRSLHAWLKSDRDKTLAGLSQAFGEKSFAIIFLILMALPALPIPTGGVTHVTELMTALLSLELIAGRKLVWLPRRWLKFNVSKLLSAKAIDRLVSVVKWFERFSRRRWSGLLVRTEVLSVLGLVILIFTIAAFVAPPFSGLDTLPALGVVVIALALILEDSLFVGAGIILGIVGIGLEIAAGTALYSGLTHFF